jgi:ABC-type nitrate/sulfonate/bicarbonate transport system substrate-binding protein
MSLNIKLIAAIVAVILVVSAAGFFLLNDRTRTTEIDIISNIESGGSGIFYRQSDRLSSPESLATVNAPGDIDYHHENWNKLIFASPSVVSIQHIQLKTIVETLLDGGGKYHLVPYQDGHALEDGNVYYIILSGGQLLDNKIIDAGITGLPRLLKTVQGDSPFRLSVLTNDLFPHQTCCVVSVNKSFADENPDVVVRTLWAITKGTEWLLEALEKGKTNPNDPDYVRALELGANIAGPVYSTQDIADSIYDIEYAWGDADDAANPLKTLKGDIAYITSDLERIKAVNNTVGDLGFDSYEDYADRQVVDTFLKEAIKGKPTYDERFTVRFALIGGDIHQLPVHVAADLGFFDEVGLDFERTFVQIGHVVVATLKANEADFGISGQPPILVDAINNKLVKA